MRTSNAEHPHHSRKVNQLLTKRSSPPTPTPTRSQSFSSSRICFARSAGDLNCSGLWNTLAFLCLHGAQAVSITRESKPRLSLPLKTALALNHHPAKVSAISVMMTLVCSRSKPVCHTSLAYTHCTSMWSTLSSSRKQVKQAEG